MMLQLKRSVMRSGRDLGEWDEGGKENEKGGFSYIVGGDACPNLSRLSIVDRETSRLGAYNI
jgi:hypothetical protein